MTRLRLGTRGSRLALAQSGWVADRIRALGLEVELVEIHTSGDRFTDVPLGPELGQSFFTKEIEDQLLDGRIDVAVHSCKDLSATMPEGLRLGAVPEREEPRDALVAAVGGLEELPAGASVGTGSPRRIAFLSRARPDLVVTPLRGNVPTRVRAVDEGEVDAVVLAAAGLRRLGMGDRIAQLFDPEAMTPAAGQGALAIQIRADDTSTAAAVLGIDHAPSHAEAAAERACMRRLEAGCQAPVGVLARVSGATVGLEAAVAAPGKVVRARAAAASLALAEDAGRVAAERLLSQLGAGSLSELSWAGAPPRTA